MAGPCLIVGATSYISRFVADASLDSGRRTYVLVRPRAAAVNAEAAALDSLSEKGAIILEGHVDDKEFLKKTLEENDIEVVISFVGGGGILDYLHFLDAIKEIITGKLCIWDFLWICIETRQTN